MTPDAAELTPDQAPGRPVDRAGACHHWLLMQQLELEEAITKVRRSQGNEAIHTARVATRRMRAVLRAWRRECHPSLVPELRFELRNLGRLLAPVREADVRRHLLATLLRSPPTELRHVVAVTMAALDQARAATRHTLRDELRSTRWRSSLERIHVLATDERIIGVAHLDDTFATDIGNLRERIRKLRKQLSKVRHDSDSLHTLRIRAKSLRYRTKTVAELSTIPMTEELEFLRKSQTLLGNMHDCQQVEAWCISNASFDAQLRVLVMARLDALASQQREELGKLHAMRWRSRESDAQSKTSGAEDSQT